MRYLALIVFCTLLFAFTTVSEAVTVQITVFCDGDIVYDNAVTTTGSTAWDAIKASGEGPDKLKDGWLLDHIAGCGDNYWGVAFWVNGGIAMEGVGTYQLEDGDHLIFVGPNSGGHLSGILYLDQIPDTVDKNESFRIKVMEYDAYDMRNPAWGGYDQSSAGAEVTVGNDTYQTGSDGWTEEITLDYDGFYCVGADKSGYISTHAPYFGSMDYVQVGAGGAAYCALTGEGGGAGKRHNIVKYDESSSVSGEGFSSTRSTFENRGNTPSRSTKVYQQGSGSYDVERIVKHRPSGIDLAESSKLAYAPTSFQAYNRTLGYNSKYEDSIYQKNYRKTTQSSERYFGLDRLNKTSLYNNSKGINFTFLADFQGTAELSARTFVEDAFTNWPHKSQIEEEIFGEYVGNYQIFQRGQLPFRDEELDCEEECQLECMRHCVDDPGNDESYCAENCTDVCDEYCENSSADEADFELLPCCDGGWKNLTKVDRSEHSAQCVFNCDSCNKTANSR